jgi:hypothetical protein
MQNSDTASSIQTNIIPEVVQLLSDADILHRKGRVGPAFVWHQIHTLGYTGPNIRAVLPGMLIFKEQDEYHAKLEANGTPVGKNRRKASPSPKEQDVKAVEQPLYPR